MKTRTSPASPASPASRSSRSTNRTSSAKPTSASRPPVGPGTDKINLFFVELDGPKGGIDATYNPKQITIDKTIPWATHERKKHDSPSLEFTKGDARTMSVELFFDTYETGGCVYHEYISVLEIGTAVMDKKGADRRPPTCVVSWSTGFPKFVGVIESLSVAYTMFFSNGTPCRATATLKLKEPPKPESIAALGVFEPRTEAHREAAMLAHIERSQTRPQKAKPIPAPPVSLLE